MQINLFSLKAFMLIYALGLFVVLASGLPTRNDHHPEFFRDHLCTGCNVDVPVEGHGCGVCWRRSADHHYPRLQTIQTSAMGTYPHDKSLPSSQPSDTSVPEEQRSSGPLSLPSHQPGHSVMDTSESLHLFPSPQLPHASVVEQATGLPTLSQPEHTLSQSSESAALQLPPPSPQQQHVEPSVHPPPQPSATPKSDFLPQLSTGISDQHQAPPPLPGPLGNHRGRKRSRRLIKTTGGQMLPPSTVCSKNRRIANKFFRDYARIAKETKDLDLSNPEVKKEVLKKLEQEFRWKKGDGRRMDYERIAQVAKQNGIELKDTFELAAPN
ncbi:hypothetical protein H0H93_003130 [Arthromyces matolae]|nr:hypothetical protein H0H93_003130 [Arthromyces matolae]